jgi:hypothetical protein
MISDGSLTLSTARVEFRDRCYHRMADRKFTVEVRDELSVRRPGFDATARCFVEEFLPVERNLVTSGSMARQCLVARSEFVEREVRER